MGSATTGRRVRASLLSLLILSASARAGEWRRLASLPDKEGVAAPFAGVAGGALLVAGGANFPGKKPWEGGTKVWYDAVYVLDRPDGEWRPAGTLPRPLAYGVSVTHRDGVVCVGGSDAARHHADVFRLEWKGGRLVRTELPPLPRPIANACGALVGDVLHVAGGQARPDSTEALRTVYRLDLAAESPAWREIEPLPGPGRILAVAAACDGSFWTIGGAELRPGADGKAERVYSREAFRHRPGSGWSKVAALPRPVVAAPSPAFADESGLWIFGGDDGPKPGTAQKDHPGFTRDILRFDFETGSWRSGGEVSAARVTAPLVRWGGAWVVTSGEVRPGVRSPEVWSFSPR